MTDVELVAELRRWSATARRQARFLERVASRLEFLSACAGSADAVEDDLGDHLRHMERALIVRALRETGGNQRRAATNLGIARTTLIDKIRRLRVELPA